MIYTKVRAWLNNFDLWKAEFYIKYRYKIVSYAHAIVVYKYLVHAKMSSAIYNNDHIHNPY